MSWRTVVITTRCKLDLNMGFMVIRGEDTKRIFLDEIALLLIENPAVSLTGCLLEALTEKKIRVVFCDSKRSVSTLLKAVGIEIRDEYEGHRGEVEKVLDYMELVREFDRDKLFITVNMRSFFDDDIIHQFQKTALSHEFKILMLESQSYPHLPLEKRITIDEDLCEF